MFQDLELNFHVWELLYNVYLTREKFKTSIDLTHVHREEKWKNLRKKIPGKTSQVFAAKGNFTFPIKDASKWM
jgi:hypothetical protein